MTARGDRTMPSNPAPGPLRHPHPVTARLIDEMRARGFVTASEAATRSNIPLPTIYAWAREGLLTCQVTGKRRLFIALESLERVRSRASTPALGADASARQPTRARTLLRSGTRDARTVADMHARGFVTPAEAALLSRTPLPTVYSWVRAQALECETHSSGRVFISLASLRNMIAPALVEQRQLLEQMWATGWNAAAVARAGTPQPTGAGGARSPWTADLIAKMRARGFVTPAEAAELSHTPRVTIYSWLKDGTLKCEVFGRRRLFVSLESLYALLPPAAARASTSLR